MRAVLQVRWQPRKGSRPAEYEDAWACPGSAGRLALPLRLAVADGASETSFAGLWAGMLARAYAGGSLDPAAGSLSGLDSLRRRWHRLVLRRPLAWHAQEKVRQGACATFLGLRLEPRRPGAAVWYAIAAGDCCLFQLRAGRLLAAFPVASSAALPLRPAAICSAPGSEGALMRATGRAAAGDVFLIMTDALAGWFLRTAEHGQEPWRELADVAAGDPAAFADWTEGKRSSGSLRNDDVTLARLSLGEP